MKRYIFIIISLGLIFMTLGGLNDDPSEADQIRRPFIPGREQNLF